MEPGELAVEVLTQSTISFEELLNLDGRLHWVELEVGDPPRLQVVREHRPVTPPSILVGSRLYEYGGGAVASVAGELVFSSKSDDLLHAVAEGRYPRPITSQADVRYGDLGADATRACVVAVEEDRRQSARRPTHRITAVGLDGTRTVLVEGAAFYASPRVSSDGAWLAWVEWDPPDMPWDASRLMVAPLGGATGAVGSAVLVAGGLETSVCYPRWSPDGSLFFLSDESGWWNLYTTSRPGEERAWAVCPLEADCGWPGYTQSRCSYDVSADAAVLVACAGGSQRLLLVDRVTATVRPVATGELTVFMYPRLVGDHVAFVGGSASLPLSVWTTPIDDSGAGPTQVKPALPGGLDGAVLAEPERIEFPTSGGAVAHGYFYPPATTAGPAGCLPPLVVMIHGGPVAAAIPAVMFGIMAAAAPAFWTSRGFAVVDVDYRGSIGYGRDYRRALRGRWGRVDVDDAAAAVRFLAGRGDIDPRWVVIRGGSAGGFTTLMALATTDTFRGGTAYFPVADFAGFDKTAHKFEAHYNRSLVGDPSEYPTRSPRALVAGISAPLTIVQGDEDAVCPPAQTREFVEAARAAGKDVRFRLVSGEAHGFVHASNIADNLRAEEAFYAEILGR
jgi:dipeptidyl aminopeptidase/acylaminoacyl peptidase